MAEEQTATTRPRGCWTTASRAEAVTGVSAGTTVIQIMDQEEWAQDLGRHRTVAWAMVVVVVVPWRRATPPTLVIAVAT